MYAAVRPSVGRVGGRGSATIVLLHELKMTEDEREIESRRVQEKVNLLYLKRSRAQSSMAWRIDSSLFLYTK